MATNTASPAPLDSESNRNTLKTATIDLGPLTERVSVKPREACTALAIGTTRFYELLSRGELASYHEGRGRRILVSSIRDYLARRLAEAASSKTLKADTVATVSRRGRR